MGELEGPARTVCTSTGLFYIEASDVVTGICWEPFGGYFSYHHHNIQLAVHHLFVCLYLDVPNTVLLGLRGFGARIYLNGLSSFIHSNAHM